ncbi:MAG TPA: RimK family alpha-L-glutamate ligase [Candidatus Lokiarchaeia archaeon]|nr:RimK family alpha-L-glutamate ligase [Candidatus Lokiarchaeia archaeon]
MEIWILYDKADYALYPYSSPAVNRLWETAEERGITISVVAPQQVGIIIDGNDHVVLVDGERVAIPDFVLTRMGAHIKYAGRACLRQLESLCVRVVNSSEGLDIVTDKLFTLQILNQHGLPVPKTMLLQFPVDFDLVEQYFGFPLILKVVKGNKGQGVMLVESRERLEDLVEFIHSTSAAPDIILQEFITTSKGRDVRVFVVGQQVVACMERHARPGGFKANFHEGGTVESISVTPEIEELAFECAELLKIDIFGLDLLFGETGFIICEVNGSPGWEGLELANPGLRVADIIYDYIENQIRTPFLAKHVQMLET